MRRAFAAVLLLPALALAQSSFQTIGYQGQLKRSDGTPETQTVQITFSIHDAPSGGSLLWSETQSVTPNSGGFYALFLGSRAAFPADLFNGDDRWLELQIQGDPAALTPRQQIASVAYALMAKEVIGGIPIGALLPFAGGAAPARFLLCDGAAVSRSAYAALFAAIGTTYGAGDGSTTFNVPDLRGRTAVGAGQGAGLANRAVGSKGGEESHTLSVAEMPNHSHADSGHQHNVQGTTGVESVTVIYYDRSDGSTQSWVTSPGSGPSRWFDTQAMNGCGGHTHQFNVNSATGNAQLQPAGGGGAHNNMQPFLAVNYIIRAQ